MRDRETAHAADRCKVGCSPLAHLRGGIQRMRTKSRSGIRDDGVAAGWIQFTTNGLPGIPTDGRQTTLPEVKDACRRRDVAG